MWNDVVDNLERLRGIDRQCQAFGASRHQYLLHPCLSSAAIDTVEHRLGVRLPLELRSFYTNVGDGIAGPCYGLKRGAELSGFRPAEAYPGIETIREVAMAEGIPPDDSGYFEAPRSVLAGLQQYLASLNDASRKCIELRRTTNGLRSLMVSGLRNHRDEAIFQLFEWLAQNGQRSTGVLFARDDEDSDRDYNFRDYFRVYRLAHGEFKELGDLFAMPESQERPAAETDFQQLRTPSDDTSEFT